MRTAEAVLIGGPLDGKTYKMYLDTGGEFPTEIKPCVRDNDMYGYWSHYEFEHKSFGSDYYKYSKNITWLKAEYVWCGADAVGSIATL